MKGTDMKEGIYFSEVCLRTKQLVIPNFHLGISSG